MNIKGNKIKNADLAIWGHVPPPYGGMTVHISRLVPKLREAGIRVQMYNLNDSDFSDENIPNYSRKKFLWFIKLLFGRIEKVHYIISVRPIVRLLAVVFGMIRNKKIILRIGGASLYRSIYQNSDFSKLISRFAIRNASAVIGVNKDICNLAVELGGNPENIHYIPGFIPPSMSGEDIPDEVAFFLENKSPKLLISGILSSTVVNDIYGIRDALDMMQLLTKKYSDAGLVIFVHDNDTNETIKSKMFTKLIIEKDLSSSVLIHHSKSELWSVFKVTDIFLRPSYFDGDSNSIREALYLGVPVIASDCVERPETVVTFPTGNRRALYETITELLPRIDNMKSIVTQTAMPDNSQMIIDIMKKLLN